MKRKIGQHHNSITGIGFKNFRRFEEFPLLELGEITYMVGRNNSGKSTMVKAWLLVMDYLHNQLSQSFSFENSVLEDANIVTYGRAKYHSAKGNFIEFHLKLNNCRFTISVTGDDEQTKVGVAKLEVIDEKKGYNLTIDYLKEVVRVAKKPEVKEIKFEAKDEIKKIEKELFQLKEEFEKYNLKVSKEALKIADQINFLEKKQTLTKPNQEKTEENFDYDLQYPLKAQEDLEDEDDDLHYYDWQEHNGALHSEDYKEYWKEWESIDHKYPNSYLEAPRTEDNELKEIVSIFIYHNNIRYKKYIEYREKIKSQGMSEKFADAIELYNERDNLIKWVDQVVSQINSETFYYLGANPSKQSALFSIRAKDNTLAQAIHEFKQSGIKKGETEWNYIQTWMKEFEVGEDFEINFFAGEAYEFHVIENGNKIHLADKGMGSLQAMMIILRVASLIRKTRNSPGNVTLIVEEPEINLHPELQSKLTSFFLNVNTYYGFKFIIETHSEYIIRQSQYLGLKNNYFADQNLNPNPFKVYYFHKDEGPYEMKYKEDSKFERGFGKGFFDEADDLAVKAYKLNLTMRK
ncbi:MAG: AAA family ATPase [Gillisia sp.]